MRRLCVLHSPTSMWYQSLGFTPLVSFYSHFFVFWTTPTSHRQILASSNKSAHEYFTKKKLAFEVAKPARRNLGAVGVGEAFAFTNRSLMCIRVKDAPARASRHHDRTVTGERDKE